MKKFLSGFGIAMATFVAAWAADVAWRVDFANPVQVDGQWVMPTSQWKVEATKIGVNATRFYVKSDPEAAGGHVLVIDCDSSTGGYITELSDKVDLKKTPVMRWRWRVLSLPPKGDCRTDIDDQPVGLYIGADASFWKKQSVAYRWENLTPKGYSGMVSYAAGMMKVKYFTLENYTTALGTWVVEERNVAKDFKEAFGTIPDEFALSICGNSQYSDSHTVAEIDYIEFVSE